MKVPLPLAALGLLLATGAQADPFLVIPGRSLGRTHLGRNGSIELKRLQTPTASDAAMMHDELVWVSRPTRSGSPNTLYIRTLSNSVLDTPVPGVTIYEIRATSPLFHTRGGISPGSTLAQIHRRFPQGHLVKSPGNFYVADHQGIAFAFTRAPKSTTRCAAVSVYPPGTGHNLATFVQVSDLIKSGHT